LRLESGPSSEESAAAMDTLTQRPRRILRKNVLTVVSAAILIGAEVFGAAFAGSWAIANLMGLGRIGARLLDGVFVLCGIAVMVQFIRSARRVEPMSEAQAAMIHLDQKPIGNNACRSNVDRCPISVP